MVRDNINAITENVYVKLLARLMMVLTVPLFTIVANNLYKGYVELQNTQRTMQVAQETLNNSIALTNETINSRRRFVDFRLDKVEESIKDFKAIEDRAHNR